MKKEIAKKWVKALTSGKYKQGKTYLKQVYYDGQAHHWRPEVSVRFAGD